MQKLLLLIVFVVVSFGFAGNAYAAIAFNSQTQNVVTAGTVTNSFSHTTAGSNRLLVILVVDEADSTLSNITYNSVAATLVNSMTDGGGNFKTSLYYLVAPTLGANTVSVTRSDGTRNMAVFASSYTGVAQTSTSDGSVLGSGAAGQTTVTNTITTTTDNDWMIRVHAGANGGVAASTNSTIRGTIATLINGNTGMFDSNGAITPAQAFSMTSTQNSGRAASVAFAFKPFVEVPAAGGEYFNAYWW